MSERDSVPVIGLVGGVGSGKTSVARLAGELRPIVAIDGDRAGHRLLQEPEIIERLRERFGDVILDEQRRIDRAALGREVFGPDEPHREARADLERILHPRIREALQNEIAAARATPGVAGILLDAAVLFEAGWNDLCDAVVFLDVPRELRVERVKAGRGWDEAKLRRREASQWPLEPKRNASHHVVRNAGPPEQAAAEIITIFDSIARNRQRS